MRPVEPGQVLVGCCGFPGGQKRCFASVEILEVQQTFYQPPRVETAARWRAAAPAGFVFTLKAWQLVTHEASSPTYRRLREPLSDAARRQAGGFRFNTLTRRAWARTLEIAAALDAPLILLQTPRSFTPDAGNLRRLRRFLEAVERQGRRIAFEPRGERWTDDVVRSIVEDLEIVHAVDPFLDAPIGGGLRYFRLHGLPRYNHSYRFTAADLDRLRAKIEPRTPYWVLFNNLAMLEDAVSFRRLVT
jgi:uncharacterized protein YecE (DUF72 family)